MKLKNVHRPWSLSILLALSASVLLVSGCNNDNETATTSDTTNTTSAAKTTLAILATTDVHTNILSYDYYKTTEDKTIGLERTAALIQQARAQYPNSILLDNGDTLQGTAMSDYQAAVKPVTCGETAAQIKVMNYLRYDAMAYGNHEFNYGLPWLDQVTGKNGCAGANFPIVVANVLNAADKKPRYPATTIVEKTIDGKPIKIGVFGVTPPQIVLWDKRHLDGKVVTEGIKEGATKAVAELKAKGADIIVALNHGGMTKQPYSADLESAGNYVAEVPGIHAMIMGHSHSFFPDGKAYADIPKVDNKTGKVNGVPAVMPGFWGNHLGVITLELEQKDGKWSVASSKSEIRPIAIKDAAGTTTGYVAPDPQVKTLVQVEHDATVTYVSTPIGTSEMPIASFFSHVGDSTAMELINKAQTRYVNDYVKANLPQYASLPVLSAAAPFKMNFRGSGYTDIPAGGVAIKNVADLYLYPNTVQAVKIDGKAVTAWLEKSAQYFKTIDPTKAEAQELIDTTFPSYNFDVIDGVTYEIDVAAAVGSRIKNLRYQGMPVTDTQEFIVATNNYRASGGGGFAGLNGSQTIFESPDTNRDMIVEYIKTTKTLTKANSGADKNWRFSPLVTGGTVTFKSACDKLAVAAADGIANVTQTSAVKDENGDCTYSIDLSK
jgi:2',3'-cyclic-nucleotide 2'-phosphodiesterase/3'-nucleotidase